MYTDRLWGKRSAASGPLKNIEMWAFLFLHPALFFKAITGHTILQGEAKPRLFKPFEKLKSYIGNRRMILCNDLFL